MSPFFNNHHVSLKICGVTAPEDAYRLVEYGVEAIGINFWSKSKRYCSPENALNFAPEIKGSILRVGVFVNATEKDVLTCFENNLIDVAQFHGDESPNFLQRFSKKNLPFIRALSVDGNGLLPNHENLSTQNLLLDAHAPGVYGGTGKTINWNMAADFVKSQTDYAIMLAGGITPENAAEAAKVVQPCALDIASGAESAPGVKDFDKIRALIDAITRA